MAEQKYPREELLANAKALFNCKPEVVSGALHGVDGKELSIDEVRKLINKFLRKKVS